MKLGPKASIWVRLRIAVSAKQLEMPPLCACCGEPSNTTIRVSATRVRNRRDTNGAFGFRLRFDHEVIGPIAVGYAAHQGLGQFVAIE